MSQYYPYPQQNMLSQAPAFVPKTAINDLDSFISGLTDEDRGEIFSSPEFSSRYGEYLNRFLFYLLQGDLGTEYVNSSSQRRDMAEQLKLMAQNIYAKNKKATMSEVERLQKENADLQALLKKKGGDNAAK